MKKFKAGGFLLESYRQHRLLFLLLLFFIIVGTLSDLLPPYLLSRAIDTLLREDISAKQILFFTLTYFSSYLLSSFSKVMENLLIDTLSSKLIHELRYRMMEKKCRIQGDYFRHHGTGEMTSRIMDDVLAIESLFSDGLVSLLISSFSVISILVSLFFFSWMLGLLAIGVIPLVLALTLFFRKRLKKEQLGKRKIAAEENNDVSESLLNHHALFLLGKEDYREEGYRRKTRREKKANRNIALYSSLFSPLLMSLRALLIGLLTLLVSLNIHAGFSFLLLSAGGFAASVSYLSNIFAPIQELGMEIQSMQEGLSGMKRVEAFMNEKEVRRKDPTLTEEKIFASGKLLLEAIHLSFRYPDGEKKILSDTGFTLELGESVYLTGKTGEGKTTLFRLILGIAEPTEGKILLNGYDVSKIPDGEKRKIFGVVSQSFEPIKGTIKEEITLKDPALSLEAVRRSMKEVQLDEYVLSHCPKGYDTPFSAQLFSEGQLSLLNLARALVSAPKILLLDEVSANLDRQTEKTLIQALKKDKGRTILSISHRLSKDIGFDKEIFLEGGKLKERKNKPSL